MFTLISQKRKVSSCADYQFQEGTRLLTDTSIHIASCHICVHLVLRDDKNLETDLSDFIFIILRN